MAIENNVMSELENLELFDGLKELEIRKFIAIGEDVYLSKGEVLSEYGAEGFHMYALLEGCVEVHFLSHNKDQNPQMCHVHSGQIIGEMSLLDGGARSARLKTAENCHLLAFHRDLFFGILENDLAIGYLVMKNMARMISKRLRYTNLAIRHQMFD